MSPTAPPLNPSLAVERIREIIVGRQLERLEQRVVRLESAGTPGQYPSQWEDRLCTNEARIEALQQSLQRLAESTREDSERRTTEQREEIHRLAAQIQEMAARKSAESGQAAVAQLEQKIGAWLSHWQSAFHTHVSNREQNVMQQLRGEVATLWENTESQITRLESRLLDSAAIEERFRRIAVAARALADCASPSPTGPEHVSP